MTDPGEERNKASNLSAKDAVIGSTAVAVLGYFLTDWRIMFERVADSTFQWVALFVLMFWFFSATAWNKGERGYRPYLNIAGLCAGLLVIFAFVTEGYGCSPPRSNSDCRPAGPAIYNDC